MLDVERRPDGSLLLSSREGGRAGVGLAGIATGLAMLAGVALADVTVLGGVVVVPLGLITLLAGVGAVRHRDWILFDRTARRVFFRRGLASMFRSVSAFSYDDVEAVQLEPVPGRPDAAVVALVRAGDFEWPIDASPDPAYVERLAAAVRDAGGWPVRRADVGAGLT
ncbi:MAG: hypothetical protein ACREMB_18520 [Candidatus Rokuibacteriota bacterium]